ncbi:hypothetical protein [Adhaeribacter aquaticus]|uniref:hypothetical protein n=1 Tax=Adhaeribacter aquaticus TaxID=299567 RepID=UPI0012FC7BE1|nr:hypothetical protein [Adhaeribacter aquaticus]
MESILGESEISDINDKKVIAEAVVFVDFRLDTDGELKEVVKYLSLKEKLLTRLKELE